MKANLLKAEMAAQGLSMRELAEKARISRSTLSAKLNGQRAFDTEEAIRLCEILNITDNQRKVEIFLT